MREYGKTDQTIMHCIFLGPPGVGKSSLLKRLLRMKLGARTSTEVMEKSIRVDIVRDVSISVAQVSGFEWNIVKDPMTQASRLIGHLSTEQEKESTLHEGKEQVLEDSPNIPAEEVDVSLLTTLPAEAFNDSQITNSSADKRKVATSLAQEPVEASNLPADGRQIATSLAQEPQHNQRETASNSPDSKIFQYSKTIDFFRRVLNKRGISEVHVDNQCTLYLTDSGGQPQFQELLPALAVGPSVFFLVLPLNKSLNSKYEVEYVRPDKRIYKYTSSLTIKEDIMRSLASIACIKCKDIYGREVKPRVLLVATFKDEVPQKKDRQRRLKELQDLVKETDAFHQGMIVDASETQMVFTINNASDVESENDAKKIRDAFQILADDFKVRTPSPWLIFSILVQHVYANDSVISKQQCFEIAQECGIHKKSEFEAALQFIHRQTGVLHYYTEPHELSQIVIQDPQHLFSRVNQLVERTFAFEGNCSSKCTEDFKRGIFKRTDYERLTKRYSQSKLCPVMLLKLLEHLNVVVRLGGGEKYFMPCAIAHLDAGTAIDRTQLAPLMITFESGYCPKGLFGALVVCIANKQVANCTLNLDESEICRDQICFIMGLHRLLLRINPTYIYIELIGTDTAVSPNLCTLCNSVRKLIEDNITKACRKLRYSTNANYRLSSVCQCSQKEKLHPAELKQDPLKGHFFQCTQTKNVVVNPEWHVWLSEVRSI